MSSCLPCGIKSTKKEKTMTLVRKALITANYSRARRTFTSLSGYLVQRETRDGLKLFIEMITTGGFVHRTGARSNDRLISVNYARVDGIDFDNLLDSIKSLMPLMLGLERNVDGTITPFTVILDIVVGDDLNPIEKFIGIFWNSTVDEISPYLPIEVPRLLTYSYLGQEADVYLKTKTGGDDYWLSVDKGEITFTANMTSSSSFTKYRYAEDSFPQPTKPPVIFVPTDHPDHCLAATPDNILQLDWFDETYTGERIAANDRFLLQEPQADEKFLLESSVEAGYFIHKGEDDKAEMSTTGTLFLPD